MSLVQPKMPVTPHAPTDCHYTLTLLDAERAPALVPAQDHFERTVEVNTVGECAERCAAARNCSTAQFDPNKSTVGDH